MAGELHNHKILDELRTFFRAGNLKAIYATAEKVLRVQSGNPVVRSVIVDKQLISDRDQVDQASQSTSRRYMESRTRTSTWRPRRT